MTASSEKVGYFAYFEQIKNLVVILLTLKKSKNRLLLLTFSLCKTLLYVSTKKEKRKK